MTRLLFTILLFISSFIVVAQNKHDAILGEWLSSNKNAKFLIFKTGDKYFGKIIWGQGMDAKDTKNQDGILRKRDLVGLAILNNLVFDGDDTWEEGTIYAPKNGKTYSCKLTLKSSTQFNVRGYIGSSLLGRTEIWSKIK